MRDNDPELIDDFYVYLHRKKDTGEVFYVGKGRKGRAQELHRRSPEWREIVSDCDGKYDIEYVGTDLLEDEAFRLEAQQIEKYGRAFEGTGSLVNRTAGGENELGDTSFEFIIGGFEDQMERIAEYQKKCFELLKVKALSTPERVRIGRDIMEVVNALDDEYCAFYREWSEGFEDDEDCDDEDPVYNGIEGMKVVLDGLYDEAQAFERKRISVKQIAAILQECAEDIEYILEEEDFQHPFARPFAEKVKGSVSRLAGHLIIEAPEPSD